VKFENFLCDFFFNRGELFGVEARTIRLPSVLSVLLIASALALGVGGIFLYVYSLVPMVLVETTVVAVIVLFVLSYPVLRGNLLSINISTVLGVVAPIISISTPAHVGVLEQIGKGGLIGFLGILQLLGFYLFPILFVVLRIAYNGTLKKQIASSSRPLVRS
jgi:hypothetical protein